MRQYIYGHVSPETAYVVNDYPYGFRLRTSIRYWIETTGHGDRFVSQTLNPKTGVWNTPKKSTYNEVDVMFLNEEGHVKYRAFSHWDDEEKLNAKLEGVDQSKFSTRQTDRIKMLRAIFRARTHVKFEVVNATGWTEEQRKAHDEEQEKIHKSVMGIVAHEYKKLSQ